MGFTTRQILTKQTRWSIGTQIQMRFPQATKSPLYCLIYLYYFDLENEHRGGALLHHLLKQRRPLILWFYLSHMPLFCNYNINRRQLIFLFILFINIHQMHRYEAWSPCCTRGCETEPGDLLAGQEPQHQPVSRKDTQLHQITEHAEDSQQELLRQRSAERERERENQMDRVKEKRKKRERDRGKETDRQANRERQIGTERERQRERDKDRWTQR